MCVCVCVVVRQCVCACVCISVHLLQDPVVVLLCCLIHPSSDHLIRPVTDKTPCLVLEGRTKRDRVRVREPRSQALSLRMEP